MRVSVNGRTVVRTRAGNGNALILLTLCALLGCDRMSGARRDEARLRDELGIPSEIALSKITSTPAKGGTFGREGLRIVATFRLTAAQAHVAEATWIHAPDWHSLPLPATVSSFRFPPVEAVGEASGVGFYRCHVGVWRTGEIYDRVACTAPPDKFDQFRIAVFDPTTSQLTVVAQNYY